MSNITVMVVGSGAREHVISNAYENSSNVEKIIVSPGNDLIGFNRYKEVIIDKGSSLKDTQSILRVARRYKPDLIDVAQEDALATGTVDLLQDNGFTVFGPTRSAAKIESDKDWSRNFMERWQISHPAYRSFNSQRRAVEFVKEAYAKDECLELYVKATGLCAGKGALKASSLEEAVASIKLMKTFGKVGEVFLIEEGIIGEEFSYYGISDGSSVCFFNSAQDNKTVFNNDLGDQTGGMGAISPAMVTSGIEDEIEEKLMREIIEGMRKEGRPFTGILYLGGIKQVDGTLKVIEYNSRWGDPECQVILPALQLDYVEGVLTAINGGLQNGRLKTDGKTRVCVVAASKGYPGNYDRVKGREIVGLKEAMKMSGVNIYGAGVSVVNGNFYANGGRLFSIVGEGSNVIEAREKAYLAMEKVSIDGDNLHYRKDIGVRDVERMGS